MICHYIVFARFPERGCVKNHFTTTLGDEQTLELYEAMLRDTLEIIQSRTSATNADVLLFVTPNDAVERFRVWLPAKRLDYPNIHVFPQTGQNLGDAMFHAFQTAQQRGCMPALIVRTDSPTIPDAVFTQAEQALEHQTQAVIGKTQDGDFYLMGLQKAEESLFFGADYDNDSVFERLLVAMQRQYSTVEVLPEWYDIRDTASLERLQGEARHDSSLRYFYTLQLLVSWSAQEAQSSRK